MATAQLIRPSFGFSKVIIGDLHVFTCKIRIKGHNLDLGVLNVMAKNNNIRIKELKQLRKATKLSLEYTDNITEIAYETTDALNHGVFQRAIGRELRKRAQAKLDEKYSYVNNY